jgi:hypothetical protein
MKNMTVAIASTKQLKTKQKVALSLIMLNTLDVM